jgi:hypothetical protein
MENNLAVKECDYMFNNEDSIIELSNRIEEQFKNLTISDEKKSELKAHCISGADSFNKKFSKAYDKIYIDNYLEFIDEYDYEEEEEELDEAEQFLKDTGMSRDYFNSFSSKNRTDNKEKKCVCDSDSESESEDESGGDLESERDYLEKENEDNIHFINNLKKQLQEMEEKQKDRMKKIEQRYIDKIEELKEKNNELGSKVANLTRENEVKDAKIKQLEALREQDNSIINQYIQLTDKKDKIINEKYKEIFYYESKVREMNEHTKLNNN